MAVVCVDAGTTMIKAVGYDDQGTETVVLREATQVSRPAQGWAEQGMAAVWGAVVDTVRGVVHQLEEGGHSVDFLAFTAQGDGCWLVDSGGRPTGPAILWNDGRAAQTVQEWDRAGVLEQAFRINGSLTNSGQPNAILTWLRANDPARLDTSAAALTCGGWIFSRLTGDIAVDESDGSAPFMDIRSRSYSPELLELYGMPWAEPLLPRLRGDYERVGALTPEAAIELGLAADTPVVMSSYDIASTAIGVGAVLAGQACSILGTTLCTEVVTDDVRLGEQPVGLTVVMGVPGRYLRAFPTFAGGEVIQWACRLLGLKDPSALGDLALGSQPGASGLSFLPYLSPAGERAPFLDPNARGSFMGLSLDHGREHIARAVLEGLTMVIRDCLDASQSQPSELRVCGGGAASSVWLQLIADITRVPTTRSADSEVGAKGAYLMGLVSTGAAPDFAAAAERSVRLGDTFRPDPTTREHYLELFDDFLALRETASAEWLRLRDMRERAAALAATGRDSRVSAATSADDSALLSSALPHPDSGPNEGEL